MQRIRDAERKKIYEEFSHRVGQVVTGTVQRFERRDVIMNIGKPRVSCRSMSSRSVRTSSSMTA